MAGIGVFACIGHFFLILSLKYADASKLAPLGYTEIIPNILIGFYFFNEIPDNWTYLGLFIIVLSGLYISRREYLITRKLSKSDNPLLTLLMTGLVGAILVSLVIPFYWVKPTLNQWSLMAGIGVFACIGHFFLILSLKYADASKLAPLGYTEIIPNILIGFYFFNEIPDNWTYLGLLIIVLSGLYISRREYFLSRSY